MRQRRERKGEERKGNSEREEGEQGGRKKGNGERERKGNREGGESVTSTVSVFRDVSSTNRAICWVYPL